MSKARQLADNGAATPNRNLIINGAMNVAQRGTSLAIVHDGTSNGYTCDRWLLQEVQHDQLEGTLAQVAVTDLPEFNNALKWTTTEPESAIAANEDINICQKIEAQNCQRLAFGLSGANKTTLSFYVKSSVTGTYGVNFYKADSAGDLTSKNFTSTYTINSANTWEKKTIAVVADTSSSGAIVDDTGEGIRISWFLGTGSDFTSQNTSTAWTDYANSGWAYGHAQNGVATTDNATWFLAGVQLEVGEAATPFEHKTFAQDLHECERYYQRIAATSDAYKRFGNLFAQSATLALVQIPLTQTLRAIPTIVSTGTAANYGVEHASTVTPVNSALSIKTNSDDGTQSPHVYISTTVGSGLTTGQGGVLLANNNTSAFVGIDSEL